MTASIAISVIFVSSLTPSSSCQLTSGLSALPPSTIARDRLDSSDPEEATVLWPLRVECFGALKSDGAVPLIEEESYVPRVVTVKHWVSIHFGCREKEAVRYTEPTPLKGGVEQRGIPRRRIASAPRIAIESLTPSNAGCVELKFHGGE